MHNRTPVTRGSQSVSGRDPDWGWA